MFGLSKSITSRLVPFASGRVCGVRHKGTVPIITISPPPPNNDRTMGPYPRTPEERLKAARKYNLIPEDYETYDEDEGWGDYPKLPAIGAYNRDKYDDFDDIFHCRYYGEPLHRDCDLYTWERIDPLEDKKIPPFLPPWKKYAIFFAATAFVPVTVWIFETLNINVNQPYKIRDFNGNRPLYEFPPSPNDSPHHHGAHH